MNGLNDLESAGMRNMGTLCLTKAALAVGSTSAAKLDSTGTITFAINGKYYTHAVLNEEVLTSQGLHDTPAGVGSLIVVGINAAGAVKMYQSAFKVLTDIEQDTDPTSSTFGTNISVTRYQKMAWCNDASAWTDRAVASKYQSDILPVVPDSVCPIGIVQIPAGAFTIGTTSLTTAAATFTDIMTMPANANFAA